MTKDAVRNAAKDAELVDPTALPSGSAASLGEAELCRLALSVTRGDLRRPWSVQTSNSFRRIGTDRGDGDVLCAVTQPSDGHPDLRAAPDVLDYVVAAHPFEILRLIRERDSARHALHLLRHKIAGHDEAFREAGGMSGVPLGVTEARPNTDPHPPIASYALGQSVTIYPGFGDHWHPGIVTRLESGLRADGSAWHSIYVGSSQERHLSELKDEDAARVSPSHVNELTVCPE